MSKFRNIFTILAGIFLGGFWIQDAFAYIDPGSASLFAQALIGVLVGVGVAVKIYWIKIVDKFRTLRKV